MIGNAVSVDFAKNLAESIKDQLTATKQTPHLREIMQKEMM